MGKRMLLSEYMPNSELVVEEHLVLQPKFNVFDVHTHFGSTFLGNNFEDNYDTAEVVEALKQFGVKRVINLDGMWGETLDRMLRKTHHHKDFFVTFGSVDVFRLNDKNFETYVRQTLIESKEKGIQGLKFFKEVSLELKDSIGRPVQIDDQRLKVIWDTAAELELPVLIHIADPVAFFKPIDCFNERYDELQSNPEWSFYRPGMFTFEEFMKMQENLLAKNPGTTFIIAHGGSYSENLSYVGKCLDKYPNMNIDIAARVSEFGRQPYTSRKFFDKYQDRILFGTDGGVGNTGYPIYYRFLETQDEYYNYSRSPIPKQGRWNIYGIYLDDEILKKVYYKNAERLINGR